MSLLLDIDESSHVPVFEQLRSQLAELIGSGRLTEGCRLPPIRQLSADLGLAPGTVARVYKELEQTGYVRSRVRHGTTVTAGRAMPASATQESLAGAARAYAASAYRLSATMDEALAALREQWPTPAS